MEPHTRHKFCCGIKTLCSTTTFQNVRVFALCWYQPLDNIQRGRHCEAICPCPTWVLSRKDLHGLRCASPANRKCRWGLRTVAKKLACDEFYIDKWYQPEQIITSIDLWTTILPDPFRWCDTEWLVCVSSAGLACVRKFSWLASVHSSLWSRLVVHVSTHLLGIFEGLGLDPFQVSQGFEFVLEASSCLGNQSRHLQVAFADGLNHLSCKGILHSGRPLLLAISLETITVRKWKSQKAQRLKLPRK